MDIEIKKQIKSYYDYWFSINALYEKWAKKYGLTSNSLFVIYTINEYAGQCNQKFMCEKLLLPKQTVNTILDSIEKKGYIRKVIDEKDKRNKQIVFTDSGQLYADEILTKLYKFESEAFLRMEANSRIEMLKNSHLFLEKLTTSIDL